MVHLYAQAQSVKMRRTVASHFNATSTAELLLPTPILLPMQHFCLPLQCYFNCRTVVSYINPTSNAALLFPTSMLLQMQNGCFLHQSYFQCSTVVSHFNPTSNAALLFPTSMLLQMQHCCFPLQCYFNCRTVASYINPTSTAALQFLYLVSVPFNTISTSAKFMCNTSLFSQTTCILHGISIMLQRDFGGQRATIDLYVELGSSTHHLPRTGPSWSTLVMISLVMVVEGVSFNLFIPPVVTAATLLLIKR